MGVPLHRSSEGHSRRQPGGPCHDNSSPSPGPLAAGVVSFKGRNSKAAVEGARAKWADHRLKKDAPVGPALAFDEDHHADFDDDVKHNYSVKAAYTSIQQYTRPSLAVLFRLIHAGRNFLLAPPRRRHP